VRRLLGCIAAGLLICGAALAQTAPFAARWPHTITTPDGTSVTVYQPQAISWPDHKTLATREAIAFTRPSDKTPVLGTIETSFDTTTDLDSRTVTLSDPKLVRSRFPSLDTDQASQVDARIRAALPTVALKSVPLASVTLSLEQAPDAVKTVALNNDPPVIFRSETRSSLVVFDGEPVLAPVGSTGLKFAVNTNWDVFVDPAGTWYLLNNGIWLAAPAYSGPYQAIARLPAAFSAIPNDANFAEVRKAIPAKAAKPADVPKIFVSTKPAEIIVTDGPPKFVAIPGTALLYASNTNADLFADSADQKFYYLTSGRWFSAASPDGPWSYATPSLPADFALIPPDGPRGSVLASVPNTAQAQQAVIEAQIPHQATLQRSAATLTVTYAGAPAFKPIEGTGLTYATNTAYEVVGVNGAYYACYQGAWFVAPTPTGPWTLAASVPPVIYSIPVSNPLYNVTYVSVYGATPEAVTYGYTAGYMMGFVTAGVLAYGTGWYYPPVIVPGAVPGYFPYPYSYAGGVWYNSATGAWARGGAVTGYYGRTVAGAAAYNPATGGWAHGAAVYGPNGGAGAWSAYNPRTGTYAHGSAVWGPNGGTAHAGFYNPRYGVSGSTTQNANAYSRWGSSTVSTPNRTVNTASASTARGSTGAFQSSTGASGAAHHSNVTGNNTAAVKAPNGDVYAGHDGNVYQHSDSGWSKWDNGSWQQQQRPANQTARNTDYQQLDRDNQARSWGNAGQRYGGGYGGGGYGGGGGVWW
jgi:hypothetical protein